MAFEHVAGISLNYDKQICERQSTCYQKVLRFHIWLKAIFSDWRFFGLTKKLDESAAVLISAVFFTREHVHSPQVR